MSKNTALSILALLGLALAAFAVADDAVDLLVGSCHRRPQRLPDPGAEVTEMIQGYTIARTLESTEAELMHTVFPHPTISETMHEAVLSAY